MRKFKRKTVVYDCGDGFYVEGSKSYKHDGHSDGYREFYICHERYGIKELMFGAKCKKDEIEDFIIRNIAEEKHIYIKNNFD